MDTAGTPLKLCNPCPSILVPPMFHCLAVQFRSLRSTQYNKNSRFLLLHLTTLFIGNNCNKIRRNKTYTLCKLQVYFVSVYNDAQLTSDNITSHPNVLPVITVFVRRR